MSFRPSQFGLDKNELKKLIKKHFKENADILIGIDDPEINQLVDILVSAFSEAIEKNNNKIADDIIEYIKELGDKPRY